MSDAEKKTKDIMDCARLCSRKGKLFARRMCQKLIYRETEKKYNGYLYSLLNGKSINNAQI